MKILINGCYGGFGYSVAFIQHLCQKYGIDMRTDEYPEHTNISSIEKQVIVEEAIAFGLKEASGKHASLEVVEIPDGLEHYIREYDGIESVGEVWLNVTTEDLKKGLSEEQLRLAQQASCIRISQ